jgi:uncharacterized membrane protein HdeD (DUF308 family)
VTSLLAGMIMLASPLGTIVLLAEVVGAWLIVIGVFEVISSFRIRKATQHHGG